MTDKDTKLTARKVPATKAGNARQPKALKNEGSQVSVTLRIPASLKAKLQRVANKDGRTLNNWIAQKLKAATE